MPAIKVRLIDGSFYTLPTLVGPRGLSAYEVAITEGGFIGTVEEWLESLIGPQGVQGIQGIQGPSGAQGVPGNYYQFIFRLTTSSTPPSTPTSSNDSIPAGWFAVPQSISEGSPYLWISVRQKINNVWISFSTPSLLATYTSGGSGGSITQATSSTLGGVKANNRTTESVEVTIDPSTGFLYVPVAEGGGGGGIPDVPLDTVAPKLYGRYSGDQSWQEILPPTGSVGTLQQVTTHGATTDKLLTLAGGIEVGNLLQIPNTVPLNVDEGYMALFSSESGFNSQTPPLLPIASASTLGAIRVGANLTIDPITGILSATTSGGGGGVAVHNQLTGREELDCHPSTAITGLDASLSFLSQTLVTLDYNVSLLGSALNGKLDSSHASDANAHTSLFASKANKNGSATEDFATKNLNVNGIATMVENVNTNLRIPKTPPSNPTPGEFYLYIE